ncbi:MAG: hypothetical protein ABW194_00795 [Novosphingobium sp.]
MPASAARPSITPAAAGEKPRPHPAVERLAHETRVREGPVPDAVDGVSVSEGSFHLGEESFLIRPGKGIALLYRRGEGITLDRPADADPRDIALWLNGTAYSAVAVLNGLFPLHASAVAHDGGVRAFTGPTGAGKSTLVAALGRAGFAQFCDDTLLLDTSKPGAPICLPGHKRLKLWPEGAALAGVRGTERVASDFAKVFVDPAGGIIDRPLPLAELVFLEQGADEALLPVAGGERIERLRDDHYTAQMWTQASGRSRAQLFTELAGIAARIPMRRFVRPFEAGRFADGVAFIADYLRGESGR